MRQIFILFILLNSIAAYAQYTVGTGIGYYPLYRGLIPNEYAIGNKLEVKRYASLDSFNYLGGGIECIYSLNKNTLNIYNLSLEYMLMAQNDYFLTGVSAGKMFVNMSETGFKKLSNSFTVYTGFWKKLSINKLYIGGNLGMHMYEHTKNLVYDVGLRYSILK